MCDLEPTAYNHTLSSRLSSQRLSPPFSLPVSTVIMSAIAQKLSNLAGTSAKAKVLAQNDNDVVIVGAIRSAITKVCFQSAHSSYACF